MPAPTDLTRVALVDDHDLVRAGFERLVEESPGYMVVVSESTGEGLLTQLERIQTDLVLVDLQMPGMDGHEVIRRISMLWPHIRCMVVTFDATEEALARAIRLGARGYVLKNIDPPELRRALDAVRDTGYYHNELYEHHLRDHPSGFAPEELARNRVIQKLTPLEITYLKLLAEKPGKPNKQLAGLLNGHEHSPEACQAALHHKFGITNKLSALVFALRPSGIEHAQPADVRLPDRELQRNQRYLGRWTARAVQHLRREHQRQLLRLGDQPSKHRYLSSTG